MISGVPQGTVLGPLFFLLIILMTLLSTFNPSFVGLQMIVSCIVLLDLKMIYLLYLNGQKLGRSRFNSKKANTSPARTGRKVYYSPDVVRVLNIIALI